MIGFCRVKLSTPYTNTENTIPLRFGFFGLNGISTFMGYLIPKLSFLKDRDCII